MTSPTWTACAAPSRISSSCTCARASRAPRAARRSRRWSSAGAARTCARPASRRSGSEELVQPAALGGGLDLGEAADEHAVDDHLREAQHARLARERRAPLRVPGEVDLGELDAARLEQALGTGAERTRVGGVDN